MPEDKHYDSGRSLDLMELPPEVLTLTDSQARVVKFIRQFWMQNHFAPSIRDICNGTDLSSSSSVHAQLANLEALGFITQVPGIARTVRVVDK